MATMQSPESQMGKVETCPQCKTFLRVPILGLVARRAHEGSDAAFIGWVVALFGVIPALVAVFLFAFWDARELLSYNLGVVVGLTLAITWLSLCCGLGTVIALVWLCRRQRQ